MQHEPNEPPHKLFCWQSCGEEDITSCGTDEETSGEAGRLVREDVCAAKTREPAKTGKAPGWSLAALRRSEVLDIPASKGQEKPAPYKPAASLQHFIPPTTTRGMAHRCCCQFRAF